jgi:hypothetical protein
MNENSNEICKIANNECGNCTTIPIFFSVEWAGYFDMHQMATILEVALNLRRVVEEITALCCKS